MCILAYHSHGRKDADEDIKMPRYLLSCSSNVGKAKPQISLEVDF